MRNLSKVLIVAASNVNVALPIEVIANYDVTYIVLYTIVDNNSCCLVHVIVDSIVPFPEFDRKTRNQKVELWIHAGLRH